MATVNTIAVAATPTVTVVELQKFFEHYDFLVEDILEVDVHVAAALATFHMFNGVSYPFPMIQILTETQVNQNQISC